MKIFTSPNEETSLVKTCFNAVNALSGVGLITIPYTLKEAGWLSLVFLVAMAMITYYTSLLLQRSMDSNSSIKSYSDLGFHAFGAKGKIIASIFLYSEVYLVPTGFIILEGDHLHKLFPKIGWHFIGGQKFFTIIAGLVILPSMWLRDLSSISFVSAGGVLSCIVIICSILWLALIDQVGDVSNGQLLLDLKGIPTAVSLYAFTFGAHCVFPSLYSSMEDKSKFSKVLFFTFAITTGSYIFMAVLGYLMFGQDLLSQVTLNFPTNKVASKIAIYTTIIGPISKFALTISPLANAIEEQLLPSNWKNNWLICILMRTLLLASTLTVALAFPFFGTLMTLVGAILSVTVSIILPCLCYLKIFGIHRKFGFETVSIYGIVVLAILIGTLGTYSSIMELIRKS